MRSNHRLSPVASHLHLELNYILRPREQMSVAEDAVAPVCDEVEEEPLHARPHPSQTAFATVQAAPGPL